jgi:hypothetical protein
VRSVKRSPCSWRLTPRVRLVVTSRRLASDRDDGRVQHHHRTTTRGGLCATIGSTSAAVTMIVAARNRPIWPTPNGRRASHGAPYPRPTNERITTLVESRQRTTSMLSARARRRASRIGPRCGVRRRAGSRRCARGRVVRARTCSARVGRPRRFARRSWAARSRSDDRAEVGALVAGSFSASTSASTVPNAVSGLCAIRE